MRAIEPITTIPSGVEAAKITSVEQLTAFETHNKLDAEKYLMKIADSFRKSSITAKTEVIFGKAAEALSNFASKNDVDLVVIASHGRSGISHWVWGSVAERLIRSLLVPVLIIRSPRCGPGN